MRIRAVRPDFWQDDTLGHMPDALRLFYIGLWCVADDLGWLEWKPAQLGAALYPYRTPSRRVRDIDRWGQVLGDAGRIVIHPCGCAYIPTLTKHQKMGGTVSKQYRDKHLAHLPTDKSVEVRSSTPLREGKEEEGNRRGGTGGWDEKVIEMQRRGQAG